MGTNDYLTNTRLTGDTVNGYTLTYPDGSRDVYGFIVTNSSGAFLKAFLTERNNPQSQKIKLVYYAYTPSATPVIRLKAIVDGDGRTNSIVYVTSNSYSTNLIHQVVDPYGRSVTLNYDNSGRLTNIIDVASLSSAFKYDSSEQITNLSTPYGNTGFALDASGDRRSVLVSQPDGGKDLYLYQAITPGLASSYPTNELPDISPFGSTLENTNLDQRNSFHWGPRQYDALSTNLISALTTNDFLKARMKHWLVGARPVGGTLSIEREPSPDTAGTIEGQKTWFDYAGKTNNSYEGTQVLPLLVAQVLPDGTTRFTRTERNDIGAVTNEISTYSSGNSVLLRTNSFVYSADGIDLIKATNALGIQVSSNAYDSFHCVLTNYNALGERTLYTYDSNERLTSMTAPSGAVTTNLYGSDGYLSDQIIVGLATNSFTYSNGLVYTHTDERGLTTTSTWDNLQRLRRVDFPDATCITNIYDKLDLVRVIDRLSFTNSYGYDAMRRRTSVTNALSQVTLYSYCTCGALDNVQDAASNLTQFSYDNAGRLLTTTYADGYSITNAYDLPGQITNVTDSAGTSVTNWFNNQGLLYTSSNAWGRVSYSEFDVADRLLSQTDANGVTVTNAYDNAGRLLVRGTPANGALESYGYTLNVRGPTSYTNALTNVTLFAYDTYNRKTNEISVGVTTNSFAYTSASELATLIDGNRHTTTWEFDVYGRVTNKVDNLDNLVFHYEYDANNRLTSRWTPAKGTTSYGYDAAGNLTNVDYPSSADLSLQYDALNRLTNLVDAVGSTAYAYNSAGQLLSEDGPWANDTVSYTYTNRLRTGLSLNTQPTTLNLSYGWDATKRLTNITSAAGGFIYAYQPGQPTLVNKLTLPYGHYETNSYDALGRLTDTHLANSGNAILNDHGYTLNVGNQRTTQWRQGAGYTNTVDYGYDPIGQLISAVGKESDGVTPRLQEQFGYAYDAGGNLKNRTNNALVQTFTVDTLNQLTNVSRTGTLTVAGSTTSPATNVTVNGLDAELYADTTFAKAGFSLTDGTNTFTAIAQDSYGRLDTNSVSVYLPASATYSYDLNGNLTYDGQKAYEYDDENQLIRVTVTNQWKTEFSYDGKMRLRVRKEYTWSGSWTQTGETRYLYDGMLVIQERDGNNTPVVSYTRGKDLSGTFAGAGGIGGLLARTDHTTSTALLKTAFYHADGNGNVTALMSTNGLIVAWYQYDPYGRTLAQSGPLADVNVYRFSSKAWQANSGLYYYGYRFYTPELQRWLNRDPIGELGGLNLYGYARNNPLRYVDPYGLAYGDWWDVRSYFNDGWLRYVYTGNPNASDEVYDAAAEDAGAYISCNSPLRGAFGYAGVQTPHGAGLHGEAIGVAGWDVDSGGWGGGVVAGGAGPFSYGVDKVHGSPAWPIALVDSSTLPIGGFITEGPDGVEVGLYLNKDLGKYGTVGGGFYWDVNRLGNYLNPDYWKGKMPCECK